MKRLRSSVFGLVLGALLGCAGGETAAEAPLDPNEGLVPVDGKADTAYYSNFATELEGTVVGIIEIDVIELSQEDQEAQLDRYEANHTLLKVMADAQLKLAKSQLNAEKMHLNLSANDMALEALALDDGVIRARYRVQVETLVTYKELDKLNIDAADLVNTTYIAKVASDPRDLYAQYGARCASGYQAGSLSEYNYFYYFDPNASGCDAPLVTLEFTVESLLPQVETFPEYDLLIKDGQVDVAIVFGQAGDGSAHDGDWGVMMWRTYAADLRIAGFERVAGPELGERYLRKRGEVTAVIDLYSPYDLEKLGDDAPTLFGDMLRGSEIVIYNGHSFYGSLNVLNDAANYPTDTYQILFMNSCWSYEYYTKQVFTHKATEADPTGWDMADVVNNTTYAWFVRMEQATDIVVKNLLAGAEGRGVDDRGRRYTWQNIIGLLNAEMEGTCPADADRTDCRHYRPREAHEMYGVSGVRTNSFRPGPTR